MRRIQVEAHERTHVQELKDSLDPEFAALQTAIQALAVPNDCTLTIGSALSALKALPAYTTVITTAVNNFTTKYANIPDPTANTDAAELNVVTPVINDILKKAAANGWGTCP